MLGEFGFKILKLDYMLQVQNFMVEVVSLRIIS